MRKGMFGSPDKRRSPRYDRRFPLILEYGDKALEMRTLDISKHGVLIPMRMPPPVGSQVKVTLTIRNETSLFEGMVIRHTKSRVNGIRITAVGIDLSSPEYEEFIIGKILIE
jgi:PilZ domain